MNGRESVALAERFAGGNASACMVRPPTSKARWMGLRRLLEVLGHEYGALRFSLHEQHCPSVP
jgi:hypothetical protein